MRPQEILQPRKTLLEDQKVAARIVSDVLMELQKMTKPDVSLYMLDELAERMIIERGATPYNKGYKPDWSDKPYPNTICACVDFEICHAPPSGRFLQAGSIVTYDLGVKYKTGCGDAAITVPVGEISKRQQRLLRYAKRALYAGIHVVRPGAKVGEIGVAIEKCVGNMGYSIIREMGGHHIGREMHEEPMIPNYADYPNPDNPKRGKYYNEVLKAGKILCIEPMITPGDGVGTINPADGWTFFCPDRQPVAMFEHMILVTEGGYEILTDHFQEDAC